LFLRDYSVDEPEPFETANGFSSQVVLFLTLFDPISNLILLEFAQELFLEAEIPVAIRNNGRQTAVH